MRLKEVRFTNFRLFSDYVVQLGEKSTVLIGDNGAGKTSVLSGVRRALSFLFASNNKYPKTLTGSSHVNVRGMQMWDANYNSSNRTFDYPICISAYAQIENERSEWTLKKKTEKGKYYSSLYQEAQSKILSPFNSDPSSFPLPVLAYFSDSYPHAQAGVGSHAKKVVGKENLPRDFGYYGWDDRNSNIELWFKRFLYTSQKIRDLKAKEEQLLLLNYEVREASGIYEKRKHQFESEIDAISKAFTAFTKPIDETLEPAIKEVVSIGAYQPIDDKKYELQFFYNDVSAEFYKALPQGHKRLYSIVFDIAYRSFIINGTKEPEGIVLIDEIDMHLHPNLQKEVIQRFKNAFPKVQFLFTTHSPVVLNHFKVDDRNKLLRLDGPDKGSPTDLQHAFGLDYDHVIRDLMHGVPSPQEVDKLITSLVFLESKGYKNEARNIRNELLNRFPDRRLPAALEEEVERRIAFNTE